MHWVGLGANDQRLWLRVQSSGTAVTAWVIVNNLTDGPPSESAWSAIASSPCLSYSVTGSGGMIGFCNPTGGYDALINSLTIQSYDTSTSAYDITEAYEPFTTDTSGYADDTPSNDSNGNFLALPIEPAAGLVDYLRR